MKSLFPSHSPILNASALLCVFAWMGCAADFGGDVTWDAGSTRGDSGPALSDAAGGDAAGSSGDAGVFFDASREADASPPEMRCGAGLCDPRHGSAECLKGSTCAVNDGSASCVENEAVGEVSLGGACLTSLDCATGHGCFADPLGVLECLPLCCTDGECGTEKYCDTHGGKQADYGSCRARVACTLLEPGTCSGDNGCYIVSAAGSTECRNAGTATLGAGCVDAEDCAEGLFCGGLLTRACLQLCHLESDECGGEMSCVAYSYTPAGFGVCTAR